MKELVRNSMLWQARPWGTKRYMGMKHLDAAGSDESDFIAGC